MSKIFLGWPPNLRTLRAEQEMEMVSATWDESDHPCEHREQDVGRCPARHSRA